MKTAGSRALERWVVDYDARIAAWVADMDAGAHPSSCDLGFGALRRQWVASGGRAIREDLGPWRALPEPWVGDVLGSPLAVVLCHNPGAALPAQLHPAGRLIQEVRLGARWSEVAARWGVARETRVWWGRYVAWFARLLGVEVPRGSLPIVGMDLLPWHSKARVSLEAAPGLRAHVARLVLAPAQAVAVRARLRIRIGKRLWPVVVATHDRVRNVLLAAGARTWSSVDARRWPADFPAWPTRAAGGRTRRSIELLRTGSEREPAWWLVTSAPGSNLPPGSAFDPLFRAVLERGLDPGTAEATASPPARAGQHARARASRQPAQDALWLAATARALGVSVALVQHARVLAMHDSSGASASRPPDRRRLGQDPAFAGARVASLDAAGRELWIGTAAKQPASVQALLARWKLTAAERREVGSLLQGLAAKDAALAAGLSPETIREYRRRIYRKAGVASAGELVAVLSGRLGRGG